MLLRWLIRTLFLLPIVFCMAAWLWSGTHSEWINSTSRDDHFVGAGLGSGTIDVAIGYDSNAPDGWDSFSPPGPARYWPRDDMFIRYFLGFGYTHAKSPGQDYHLWAVPLWFLILISAALFVLTYRKTRPIPHPKTAFPVELEPPQHPL